MAEILTESFCERCGTRYTFEPVDNRRKRLSAFGTLGRGIRHFVSDPGSSLDEAFAVARSETEQRSTSSALEAFHRTFNFCLSCRQYTCADCWNTVEGRCLSCAPTPDAAPPETRIDTPILLGPMGLAPAPAPTHADPITGDAAGTAVPVLDGQADGAAARADAEAEALEEAAALAEADARAASMAADAEAAEAEVAAAEVAAAEVAAAEVAAAEAVAQADARAAAEAEVARAAEEEAAALAATAEAEARATAEAAEAAARVADDAARPVLAFEPGRNLDDEIAEYERQRASAAEPEPVVEAQEALAAEPEPVVEDEAAAADGEPAAAEVVPVLSPVEPIPTAIGQPLPASAVQGPLSWPDPDVAVAAFEPHWPDIPATRRRSRLQTAQPAPLPAAARACPSCGLSLSASARFCRRCGTPQQVGDSPG
jgi:hypothetical protein